MDELERQIERLVTVQQLARMSGTASATIRQSILNGRIAARKLHGAWFIEPEEATRYCAYHRERLERLEKRKAKD